MDANLHLAFTVLAITFVVCLLIFIVARTNAYVVQKRDTSNKPKAWNEGGKVKDIELLRIAYPKSIELYEELRGIRFSSSITLDTLFLDFIRTIQIGQKLIERGEVNIEYEGYPKISFYERLMFLFTSRAVEIIKKELEGNSLYEELKEYIKDDVKGLIDRHDYILLYPTPELIKSAHSSFYEDGDIYQAEEYLLQAISKGAIVDSAYDLLIRIYRIDNNIKQEINTLHKRAESFDSHNAKQLILYLTEHPTRTNHTLESIGYGYGVDGLALICTSPIYDEIRKLKEKNNTFFVKKEGNDLYRPVVTGPNVAAASYIPRIIDVGNLIYEKKYKEAIILAEELLSKNPSREYEAMISINLMEAYFKQRNENDNYLEKSSYYAKTAILQGHNTGYAHKRLAINLERAGQIHQAIQLCDFILQPEFKFSRNGCGSLDDYNKRKQWLIRKLPCALDNEADILFTDDEKKVILELQNEDMFNI